LAELVALVQKVCIKASFSTLVDWLKPVSD